MASCFNKLKLLVIRLISKFYPLDSRDSYMLGNWNSNFDTPRSLEITVDHYRCIICQLNYEPDYSIKSIYPHQITDYHISYQDFKIESFELWLAIQKVNTTELSTEETSSRDLNLSFGNNQWYIASNLSFSAVPDVIVCSGKETFLLHLLAYVAQNTDMINDDLLRTIRYSLRSNL